MSTPTPAVVPPRTVPNPDVSVSTYPYMGVKGAQMRIGDMSCWVPMDRLDELSEQIIRALNILEIQP